MMDLCQKYGLECRNIDYYCMDATYGTGDEVVASLSHLDIVPVGDGWIHEPFGGQVEGSLMYGRGTSDDKGPSIAALYSVRALMESDVEISRCIRLIFGCNEESGMDDVAYYLKKCKAPDYAFSPDAAFPVINAEKNIINGNYQKNITNQTIVKKIYGGTRNNVVPSTATALISRIGSFHNDPDIVIEDKDDVYKITATGLPAHASTPEVGKNAFMTLFNYLYKILPVDDSYKEISLKIYNAFNMTDGQGLGIDCQDKATGALTLNLGIVNADENSIKLVFDIRHPVTQDLDILHQKLQTELDGFVLSKYSCSKGVYLPFDHPLIKILQGVYSQITGDKSDPKSMGGGTYARTLPCAVAYGPGLPDGKGKGAHMAEECIDINELLLAARIYAHSLYELSNM
jgi:succinyl-diaminopimelate desuccinylase